MSTEDSKLNNTNDHQSAIQLEQSTLEVAKLRAEIDSLRLGKRWGLVTGIISLITVLIAVLSFWFGIVQFRRQQSDESRKLQTDFLLAQQRLQTDFLLAEKTSRTTFYEKQLDIYLAVSQAAARTSTVEDRAEFIKQRQAFKELYYGNLHLVQDWRVKQAAAGFDKALREFKTNENRDAIQQAASDLADACRGSLRDILGIPFLHNEIERYPLPYQSLTK